MAQPPHTDQARKQAGELVISISIKRAEPGQEPLDTGSTSKQRSKSTSSKGRKQQREMAKYRTHRSGGRRSGTPRGVRRQRRRRRVSFSLGKKPLPAFFLFMEDHYRDVNLSGAEMAVKLGKMWHEQPEQDKDMYKKKAAQLRKRYRRRW